jgi:hypothetical protein
MHPLILKLTQDESERSASRFGHFTRVKESLLLLNRLLVSNYSLTKENVLHLLVNKSRPSGAPSCSLTLIEP